MFYVNDFVNNTLPPEFTTTNFGGPGATVTPLTDANFTMMGMLDFKVTSGAATDSGLYYTLKAKRRLDSDEVFKMRFYHWGHSSHEYQFGLFEELVFSSNLNVCAFRYDGTQDKFGLWLKTNGADKFVAFSHAPIQNKVYSARIQTWVGRITCQLSQANGLDIESLEVDTGLPDFSAIYNVGFKITKAGPRSAGDSYAFRVDSVGVQSQGGANLF